MLANGLECNLLLVLFMNQDPLLYQRVALTEKLVPIIVYYTVKVRISQPFEVVCCLIDVFGFHEGYVSETYRDLSTELLLPLRR